MRCVAYFSRSSLWLDEAAVALNLAARPLRGLFAPLDLAQVAPWGFLAIEKGLFGLFGRNELGLRLLPFAASLASLLLFERLCRRVLTGLAVPVAVGSFALGTGLISYAAQLKQYSTDIAAAIAILFLAVGAEERELTPRRAAGLGLAGLLLCALSQSVVFILAGIGLSLVLLAVSGRIAARAPALGLLAGLWGLGAGFAVWSGERALMPEVKSYLDRFWSSGFLPLSPAAGAPVWAGRQLARLFGWFLNYPLTALFMILLSAGAVALLRRRPAVALFILAPLFLAFAASAARLYPFAPGRVTAFLVPGLLLLVAEGFEWVRTFGGRRLAWIGAAVAAVAAACCLWAILRNPPPYMQEHIRPALERLQSRGKPDDALYVYYGALPAYLFYEPAFDFPMRERVFGECNRTNPRSYLTQIDALRGRPLVWILVSHDLPLYGEADLIFSYLDRIGRPLGRTDFRFHGSFSPVTLAAYDLSDAARLSAATSEDFPVPPARKESFTGLPCMGATGPLPAFRRR